jgi:sulfite reductase (NADPH) flavoprotein alpha-component
MPNGTLNHFIKLSMNDSILILYGTVTGNAEICANRAAKRLNAEGFNTVVRDIFDVQAHQLQNEKVPLICISTYGEGDPPDSAVPLWETLVRDGQFDLSHLRFSVFALGDLGYKKFCQCGREFDAALTRQGARQLAPRADSDVEYEKPCVAWVESVVAGMKSRFTHSMATLNATL